MVTEVTGTSVTRSPRSPASVTCLGHLDADSQEILGAAILGLTGDEVMHCLKPLEPAGTV